MDIHNFQKRYSLSNKDMADICLCSLPTIQKWRSGEVTPSGPARQLVQLLEYSAKGDPNKLRNLLSTINRQPLLEAPQADQEIQQLESSMTKVMDRLELMLESRRKEKALAESEARYRSMVESEDDPVCRWKPDTTLTYVNHAYANLYSKFGADLIGRKWLEFVPPEKRATVETLISDVVRRGEPQTTKHESVDKNGEIRYQEWRDIPVRNDRGDVVEFHSMGKDQTELLGMRVEVEKLNSTVNALMETCPHPVAVFSADGSLLNRNEAFTIFHPSKSKIDHLEDILPELGKKRFKRLLERIGSTDQIVYRIKLQDQLMLLTITVARGSGHEPHFVLLIEPVKGSKQSKLSRFRLDNEILIDNRPLDTGIRKADEKKILAKIKKTGRLTSVDRISVYLFDLELELASNVIEWCREGISPMIDHLQRIPLSEYPWWVNKTQKGQWIQLDDLNQLPRSASKEKAILQSMDIASLVCAPVEVNATVVGFIALGQIHRSRLWHAQEVELMRQLKAGVETLLGESEK